MATYGNSLTSIPSSTPTSYAPVQTLVASTEGVTISFSEASKGWVSFKNFIQDGGLSLNNNYYTFKNTTALDINGSVTNSDFLLWQHHCNEIRNNFYGQQYDSHVDVLFNEESATVKSFASMKYEGSQSKITEDLTDPAYFNNQEEKGWYVDSGITDLQEAGQMEFKNKEGKWFSYMKGTQVKTADQLNSKEFSYQGIDVLGSTAICTNCIYGCIDPIATNYDPSANIDDGSCIYPPYSCWECDSSTGNCIEDTNPLNGPCNDYATEAACLAACSPGPRPRRYTLTINDSTPPQQQVNYNVSTFTKTNILGDTVLPMLGTVTNPAQGNWSEYVLEITPDANHTVKASDFAIEFPLGTASVDKTTNSGLITVPPSQYVYADGDPNTPPSYVFIAGGKSGAGLDLGTGPLVSHVVFTDSENSTNDNNWTGPTTSNEVIVWVSLATDMQDNTKGVPIGGAVLSDFDVYMTDNGMSTTNSTGATPGNLGDLDIFINIIGRARPTTQEISGCTDPLALNYNSAATVDDGSCTYPPIFTYGCTDNGANPNSNNRPVGYLGQAKNYDINATTACDDTNGTGCIQNPGFSMQSGSNCCCEYEYCNPIIQSLDATISVTDSTTTQGNGEVEINFLSQTLPPASTPGTLSNVRIRWYQGDLNTHVADLTLSQTLLASTGTSTGTPILNPLWPIYGQTSVNGLLPGSYHVSVDTGDGCYRWFGFTVSGVGTTDIYGCTNSNAINYNPLATIDDGSCEIEGCTDTLASNYNPLATQDDGSCVYGGCTDPLAINYDVNATLDDGSCHYGCDPSAAIQNANLPNLIDVLDDATGNGGDPEKFVKVLTYTTPQINPLAGKFSNNESAVTNIVKILGIDRDFKYFKFKHAGAPQNSIWRQTLRFRDYRVEAILGHPVSFYSWRQYIDTLLNLINPSTNTQLIPTNQLINTNVIGNSNLNFPGLNPPSLNSLGTWWNSRKFDVTTGYRIGYGGETNELINYYFKNYYNQTPNTNPTPTCTHHCNPGPMYTSWSTYFTAVGFTGTATVKPDAATLPNCVATGVTGQTSFGGCTDTYSKPCPCTVCP